MKFSKLWLILLIPIIILLGARITRFCVIKTFIPAGLHSGMVTDSTGQTADTTSAFLVSDFDQIMIFYNVTGITSGDSTFCKIQTQDPISENWVVLDSTTLASGWLTDTTTVMKKSTNPLGKYIRVISTYADTTDSMSFSVSAILK